MPFCLECALRSTCKKICKKLEQYLSKFQAKNGYSDRHYRRKIRLFPIDELERIAGERAFRLKFGVKKQKNTEE